MKDAQDKIKFLKVIPKNVAGVLDIKYADIQTIKFLPDNIKAHDKPEIKASIRQYGFVEPIGINKRTGHDIFGNGRLECLLEMLGDNEDCPKGIIEEKTQINKPASINDIEYKRHWFAPIVDGLDFSDEDEEILAMKLNRANERGGINYEKAYEVLKRIKEKSEEKFVLTGYNSDALERIQMMKKFFEEQRELLAARNNSVSETENDSDDEPELDENFCKILNEKWKVAPGDLFQIGNHRLLCGDATSPVSYQTLVDSRIRLVFSSPPYDNQRDYELDSKLDWTSLMNGVCLQLFTILTEPADVLFNLGLIYRDAEVQFYWNDWLKYCKKTLKKPLYGLYVWDKITGMAGNHNGRLAPCHEFFFHFSFGKMSANKWIEKTDASIKRGAKKTTYRQKDGKHKGLSSPEALAQPYKVPDSVIRMQKEVARGIHTKGHPATFPVKLPEFVIKSYSLIGETVFEPFCGSGTTIVACENLDRKCLAMEVSENYCALILERCSITFPELEIKKLN